MKIALRMDVSEYVDFVPYDLDTGKEIEGVLQFETIHSMDDYTKIVLTAVLFGPNNKPVVAGRNKVIKQTNKI